MRYCKRCLFPVNHPLNILFGQDGVCSGCRVHEEKDFLNWNDRLKKLKNIVYANKKRVKGRGFDCVIPVMGGGDSYFIVHMAKNVLGMNPLLVHYNHQYNTKVGIRNLANLATVFDPFGFVSFFFAFPISKPKRLVILKTFITYV